MMSKIMSSLYEVQSHLLSALQESQGHVVQAIAFGSPYPYFPNVSRKVLLAIDEYIIR
jgi:hypothetical protein